MGGSFGWRVWRILELEISERSERCGGKGDGKEREDDITLFLYLFYIFWVICNYIILIYVILLSVKDWVYKI